MHMKKKRTQAEKIISLTKQLVVLQVKDLVSQGLHHETLRRLCEQGVMIKTGRGRYMLSDTDISEKYDIVQVCKQVPHAIICLLSALQFHNIGTQMPFEVWIAIDRRAARPRMANPPLRIMRFSGPALEEGVEEHLIENVCVKVYNPSKTVADCFKYRNKIGLDVALEALRECRRERKCTSDDLWHYAKICRLANVMRPYLEAIL